MPNKLFDIFLFALLRLLGLMTGFLSQKVRMKSGKLLGRFLMFLFNKRFIIAKENITKAIPEMNDKNVRKTAIQSFENLGINLLEILMLQNIKREKLFKLLKIKNPELFFNLYKRGKGVILLSAHYGNWEIFGLGCNVILNKNFLLIVEQQTNSYITDKMLEIRTRFGNESVGRYSAAKSIIKCLQRGGLLMMLGDQSAVPNKDIFIDFFGRPTLTYKAPSSMALKFDAALIFTVIKRQSDGNYILEFIEVNHDGMSDNFDDIKSLTQKHAKMLEEEIRIKPGDWAWMHKRWKHKPSESYE